MSPVALVVAISVAPAPLATGLTLILGTSELGTVIDSQRAFDVLVPHELTHLYHMQLNPEMRRMVRQVLAGLPVCSRVLSAALLLCENEVRDGRRPGELFERSPRRHAEADLSVEVGRELAPPRLGSLEFFLVERYLLYAERRGRLLKGLVHHAPYPLREAKVLSCRQDLVEAATGLECGPWDHVCFSPGVDVEVYGLK